MKIGSFFERQNKLFNTHKSKGYFFTFRVSQHYVITKISFSYCFWIHTNFEQWSELYVTKSLMIHVLSVVRLSPNIKVEN